MSRLRAFVHNGGNVHVAIKKQRKNEIRLDMRKEKSIRKNVATIDFPWEPAIDPNDIGRH